MNHLCAQGQRDMSPSGSNLASLSDSSEDSLSHPFHHSCTYSLLSSTNHSFLIEHSFLKMAQCSCLECLSPACLPKNPLLLLMHHEFSSPILGAAYLPSYKKDTVSLTGFLCMRYSSPLHHTQHSCMLILLCVFTVLSPGL